MWYQSNRLSAPILDHKVGLNPEFLDFSAIFEKAHKTKSNVDIALFALVFLNERKYVCTTFILITISKIILF